MHDFGLLYVASGPSYLEEAIKNAALSKYYCPSLSISICTDDCVSAYSSGLFHKVIKHDSPVYSYRDKIAPLINLPYSSTLFIDSDAFVCYDIDSIFHLSSRVDVACAFAPVCHPSGWSDIKAPITFPELNSGVILLKKSPLQKKFIKQWLSLYDKVFIEHGQSWDQATFRSVIWDFMQKKRFRFLHLPDESNLRTPKPWIAGRGMPVQIVHGRIPEDEIYEFVSYLNGDIDKFRSSSLWLELNPASSIYPRYDRSQSTN